MKKTILSTVMIVALLMSTVLFSSCEKEDVKNPEVVNLIDSEVAEKDYETYIEELMASTGIDIYKLGDLEEVQKFVAASPQMNNAACNCFTPKDALVDEKLDEILNLAIAIETKYNEGNHGEVLVLFQSLCEICSTIDGFMYDVDAYGFNNFIADQNADNFPLNMQEVENLSAVVLIAEINKVSPQFSKLSEPVQTEVLAATLYINSKNNAAKLPSSSELRICLDAASAWLVAEQTVTHGVLISGLVGCLASAVGYPLCATGVAAVYAFSVASSIRSYNTSVENCHLKYGQ